MDSENSKLKKSRLFEKTTVVCLFFLLSVPAIAQGDIQKSKKLYGGFGYLSLSTERVNVSDLNKSLTSNGYGKLNAVTGSFGGGGAFVINKIVVGGNGAWLSNSGATQPGTKVNLSGGYGYFSGGYVVYSGKHAICYPTIGIGGGAFNLALTKGNTVLDFTQQMNTPAGSVTANVGGLLTNIELSHLYFLNKKGKEGFFIGLKAGYKYAPGNWKMSINNTEINNSPHLNMNGFYMTFVLGAGGLMN